MGVWNFHRRWKKIMPLSLLHKGRRKWMDRREKSGTAPADGPSEMQERRRPVQAGRRRRVQRVWEAAPYRHPGPQERAATWGRPYKNEMRVRDGRVRTPAPTKFGGIFRFCRRGRRPRRPAGAQCAPLQFKRIRIYSWERSPHPSGGRLAGG